MSANDETPSSKPPLSLDDAERLASQFTPLWEDVPEAPAAAQPVPPPNGELPPADAAKAAPEPEEAPPPSTPGDGPASSEPTPAMVAIARPMGSSPDIDPNSTELPAHRSDYAPPRPLAPAQRTMVGLAPPPPVQVQVPAQVALPQSATTTPLGLAAPRASRPALELAEQSAIGLEPAKPRAPEEPRAMQAAYTEPSRVSEPDIELPVRRKGTTRVVVGIMAVAAVLVGAGAIRTVFFKDDGATNDTHASADAPRAAATNAQPEKAGEPPASTSEPAPVEQKTATPVPGPSTAQAETPATTVAPASSAEAPPAPAATESAAPAAPANGLRLAATRTSSESTQTKAVETKARTAQRVERVQQHPVRSPVAPRRPHTEAASHPPASPQIPGGGTIVRQSPF
jgi:hypothetical protein